MLLNGLANHGKTFEAEVCVVGAGAAGLTLAMDLASRGVSVLLLESGGVKFQWESHELLDVERMGDTPERLVTGTRERFFGGTTNHWGGLCRPFDAFEFEEKPWVPNSGWPISRDDLQPYYEAAARLLNLPEVDRPYDLAALGVAGHPTLLGEFVDNLEPRVAHRAPTGRLRMGQWRLEDIKKNPLITCLLNTTVAEIHSATSGDHIEYLEGRTLQRGSLQFRARDYVLCTGAIENARLLLASNAVHPAGLGNEHDLVGRFYMDHAANGLGRILPLDPAAGPSAEEVLATRIPVGWANTPHARREYQLQGFYALCINDNLKQPLAHERAMLSLTGAPQGGHSESPSRLRKALLVNWEQAPNPRSRILLSSSRDVLGVPKPAMDWNVTEQDINSAAKSAELLSLAVAQGGRARLQIGDLRKPPYTVGGGHQMGGTRMSVDPKHGVTDMNGRVHALENLFVGGSSLFPTGGWQHPTLTIVALALRQAEFLGARHARTGSKH